MAKLIPSSLTVRLFLVSTIVVMFFLPIAGLVLEQVYNKSLDRRLQEQLKIQTYGLMGLADELEPGQLWLPESLPDERLNQLNSGRYAKVSDSQGSIIWQSQSSINIKFPNPIPNIPGDVNIEEISPPGQFFFDVVSISGQEALELTRVTVIWEGPDNSENVYTFMVAESIVPYLAEKKTFRETLLFWLGGLGIVLMIINVMALFWALRPLKRLADDIHQIETGNILTLETNYPTELNRVAENLNALINHEKLQRARYRNTLDDLAHSLKTPLTVLQSSLKNIENHKIESLFAEHISRMNNIVSYQLQRAVSAGTTPILHRINVRPCFRKVFSALQKVYFQRDIEFINQLSDTVEFFGDENDLLEIIGNLCDNACKHGDTKVIAEAESINESQMMLKIIDDGKGIPENLQQVIFQRGKRLDENNEGQGIGLSVVYDIVRSYKGSITIVKTEQGFNSIQVTLPGVT